MSPRARILLVDDDPSLRKALHRALEKQLGCEVEAFPSGPEALSRLATGSTFDLLITDMRMPEMDGMELLRRVRASYPELPVIMITAYGTIEAAVEAMRLGARDYLTKEPLELFDVMSKVEKALQSSRLAEENRRLAVENRELRSQVRGGRGAAAIIGHSEVMEGIRRRIHQVAPAPSSVLIIGESGTGKELVADAIHQESRRSQRPFLPINCAAIPKDILESELFGHERGAFTGAVGRKPGKFELASSGTLFLDEIGELPLEMQAKLLRVLEEKAFMRVGGVDTVRVDVRILAATNADLDRRVSTGEFRADLFYRLKVVTIDLPPLRARIGDLAELAAHFLARLGKEYERPGLDLSPQAVAMLAAYSWPGNVRELRNMMESMVVLSEGDELGVDALPAEVRAAMPTAPGASTPVRPPLGGEAEGAGGLTMAEIEKRHIMKVLGEQGQNRTRAARLLGIGRRTLQRKLDEYREQGEDVPPAAPE